MVFIKPVKLLLSQAILELRRIRLPKVLPWTNEIDLSLASPSSVVKDLQLGATWLSIAAAISLVVTEAGLAPFQEISAISMTRLSAASTGGRRPRIRNSERKALLNPHLIS